MPAMRSTAEDSVPRTNPNPLGVTEETPKVSLYEQCREERIKENLQRMRNLGILDLSLKLKSETRPIKKTYGFHCPKSTPLLHPSRRSSRLENSAPVVYTRVKGKTPKRETSKRKRVAILEGPRAEVYTEEHEKLLGNTERSWTRFVDGCDKNGRRIYDPFKGKTCHQCRQKTLGYRTRCSECDMVQGQFCGDCLFMRYGEHVLEALENPSWICPVCRGICNCSLCRNQKGWVPTGQIYREISKLGYKSVAHYLIQTKRLRTDDATLNEASAKRPLSCQEAKPLRKIAEDDLLEEGVLKLQNMENHNGDENTNENQNPAGSSLSLFLPPMDNQTSSPDVQVIGYLEPSKEDKQVQERTDQNLYLETRPDSYFLSGEKQTLVVDAQDLVLCNETVTQSCSVNAQEKRSKRKVAPKPCPDSIAGRLRQRRMGQSGIEENGNTNSNLNLSGRSLSLILPSEDEILVADTQDLVLCDKTETRGNSVNTRETRSKKKAALKPCPDSIAGRLRKRRSQIGIKVDENAKENLDSAGKSLSLIVPNFDRRLDSYLLSGENQIFAVSAQDIVLCDETEIQSDSVNTRDTRREKKVALEPNPDSIGGRLRLRRRSQSRIEVDANANENLNSVGSSLSLIVSNFDTRLDSYVLSSENQTLVVEAHNLAPCNETETGGNSGNARETRSMRKMAFEPNQDSIGGRLRQRRRTQCVV